MSDHYFVKLDLLNGAKDLHRRAKRERKLLRKDFQSIRTTYPSHYSVVVAERMGGSKMYELVKVGYDKLVG